MRRVSAVRASTAQSGRARARGLGGRAECSPQSVPGQTPSRQHLECGQRDERETVTQCDQEQVRTS